MPYWTGTVFFTCYEYRRNIMQNERRITTLDLTPFYKNTVGLHQIFNSMNNTAHYANTGNYPPYNIIEVSENKYKIEVAIAGFAEDDIKVSSQNGRLVIEGHKIVDETADFLHNGISSKDFERSFQLADYVEVQSAEVKNGILSVCLERIVPDALKPKEIKVKFLK